MNERLEKRQIETPREKAVRVVAESVIRDFFNNSDIFLLEALTLDWLEFIDRYSTKDNIIINEKKYSYDDLKKEREDLTERVYNFISRQRLSFLSQGSIKQLQKLPFSQGIPEVVEEVYKKVRSDLPSFIGKKKR